MFRAVTSSSRPRRQLASPPLPPLAAPVATICALLALVALTSVTAAAPGDPPAGWQAAYFANQSLEGGPALSRVDAGIDFDWGAGAPGAELPADQFSARWTAEVPFFTPCRGVRLITNDGMRVFVNGNEVLSYWFEQLPSERFTALCPGMGTHTVTVEHYEGVGTARALFQLDPQAETIGTPTAQPTPTTGGSGGSTTERALLAQHEIRGPLPEARNLAYRPRQFAAGAGIGDASWGTQRVDEPGAYAGWDVLPTPNEGITRIADRADWLVLRLNRPARLAVVWRWGGAPPAWLAGWQPGPQVVVNGSPLPSFTRQAGAGEVVLGGVYDPGTVPGPHAARDAYWVLLGEEDGRPSPAPAVPSGQEVPRPNETCPAWVHDQYAQTGPDGRRYPTWHPQIDPVYWCYFRHDHGSDPAQLAPGYRPFYGYASTAAGENEPHTGFKSYAIDDGRGQRWLLSHHFGTGSIDRACARFHDVAVAVASAASGEVLADVHFLGDFGKSVANASGEPLAPSRCPNQARESDAAGSQGERQLPVVARGAIAYEPWRLDGHRTILGLTGGLTFNTTDAVVMCNDLVCDQAVATGSTGTHRFFTYTRGFGIAAGGLSGTFYTDPHGRAPASAGQPGAVRQYVKPGLSLEVPYHGDNQTCYSTDPWASLYRCDATLSQGLPAMLENAIRPPN